ncbi:MAG: GntP family permease [Eubacterium sp.]|nr:GntP family permease [Eubacterium sp.]
MALGLIGIIIGFCIILFFTFKNVNTIILAPIACIVVAVFNQLNPVKAFSNMYVQGMVSVLGMLLPVIMLGTILGKVYTQTGAAEALADGFIRVFVDRAKGENKVRVAVAVIVILSFLLCLGGIDAFIVLYTTFPIVVRMWKKLDMPRKYIPGILMCSTAAAVCPGAPVTQNIVPMSILGTTSTSGLVPGIVAAAIIAVGTWATISAMCVKEMRVGGHFEYGAMPPVPEFSDTKRPNFFVALLPIILVFVMFGILKLDISVALSAGIILALVLMGNCIKYDGLPEGTKKRGHILATLNDGAMTSAGALFNISVISGFAAVVAATSAFQTMAESIVNLPIHPMLIVVLAIVILVALTSSPPAGMSIIVPILAGALLAGGTAANAGLITAEMIHRVSTIASVSFETLPFNGMIIIILSMTKISHKEGYMPMFIVSCIFPLIAAIVAALMFMVAPGLA